MKFILILVILFGCQKERKESCKHVYAITDRNCENFTGRCYFLGDDGQYHETDTTTRKGERVKVCTHERR